jgi:hypothetical protein
MQTLGCAQAWRQPRMSPTISACRERNNARRVFQARQERKLTTMMNRCQSRDPRVSSRDMRVWNQIGEQYLRRADAARAGRRSSQMALEFSERPRMPVMFIASLHSPLLSRRCCRSFSPPFPVRTAEGSYAATPANGVLSWLHIVTTSRSLFRPFTNP